MSSGQYQSRRLIMRSTSYAEEEVMDYASTFGWDVVDETEEDTAAGTLRVVTWEISSGVDLSYSLDDATGCPYVFVTAAIPSQRQAFIDHAEDHLEVFSREELITFHDGADTVEERAGALLMLALSSPPEFDEDSQVRVVEGLRDPRNDLREAAIYATGYTPARRYVPMLREIALHDPVQQLRDNAQDMLVAYEEAGIGEE
ncbi:hypothetical protein GCM10023319_43170 [Nocardia iowensis]